MTRSHALTDHAAIRRWVESRGGRPAVVRGTGHGEGDVGILRIDLPGGAGEEALAPVSWERWFEKFEQKNLALVVQDETAAGQPSHFNKLVALDTIASPDHLDEHGPARSR
ncbi:MAG TPA: hypothetical protein VM734_11865 [Kofleriaceae bacterium]|jgi:hypothetical protein|nr:hypothetical protein [Kofleriaceae bacterium]